MASPYLHDAGPAERREDGVVERGAAVEVGALDGDVGEHARESASTVRRRRRRWPSPAVMCRIVLASTDWATVASFATAFGTLVLAIATFASIRSANRSARVAEAAFRANLRPVLVTSRLDDPVQKIRWMDNHWARLDGAQGIVQVVDGNIYLAISLRNAGSGLAVAIGWAVVPDVARCR